MNFLTTKEELEQKVFKTNIQNEMKLTFLKIFRNYSKKNIVLLINSVNKSILLRGSKLKKCKKQSKLQIS